MRTLNVQGRACLSVVPDLVTLSFAVEITAKDYGHCLGELNLRAEFLRSSLVAAGIDRAEVKTSNFAVSMERKLSAGQSFFAGYRAAHTMSIALPVDKDRLNRVLRQIAQGHSQAEVSVVFSVKDTAALRQRVLTEAVRAAQANAATLAAAAGLRLGHVQQIDYSAATIHISSPRANVLCEAVDMGPGTAADIEPEDVAAEDSVTLVYELLD